MGLKRGRRGSFIHRLLTSWSKSSCLGHRCRRKPHPSACGREQILLVDALPAWCADGRPAAFHSSAENRHRPSYRHDRWLAIPFETITCSAQLLNRLFKNCARNQTNELVRSWRERRLVHCPAQRRHKGEQVIPINILTRGTHALSTSEKPRAR
jgi:hypothetical protein